jgi:hypothetical protein
VVKSPLNSPRVITEPQITPDDVLQQPDRLRIHERVDHVAEHSPNSVESLVSLADISETQVVEQDLLNDEDGHRLGKFRAGFHDSQTEGDDLGREQKVDDVRVVILLQKARCRDQPVSSHHADWETSTHLDQSPNDTERGQPEVLERSRLARRVQKGVEEQRNMGYVNRFSRSAPIHTSDARDSTKLVSPDVPFKNKLLVSA